MYIQRTIGTTHVVIPENRTKGYVVTKSVSPVTRQDRLSVTRILNPPVYANPTVLTLPEATDTYRQHVVSGYQEYRLPSLPAIKNEPPPPSVVTATTNNTNAEQQMQQVQHLLQQVEIVNRRTKHIEKHILDLEGQKSKLLVQLEEKSTEEDLPKASINDINGVSREKMDGLVSALAKKVDQLELALKNEMRIDASVRDLVKNESSLLLKALKQSSKASINENQETKLPNVIPAFVKAICMGKK
eukprot:TRINITY_DN1522_c0_g1_i1.p2 TRINITY_DN1522_c0_g1~~TRINITY_DN1522_c0_g1_i1.p2  ORF type:complete len:244 (+),score=43.81 TRINITY_DN1522_c0_g1_i1:964-1695(+)